MTEINHFSHKEHSLKLFEKWKSIVGVGGDNDEKIEVICCYGCQKPILGGSVYGCTSCYHFLHETCANLAPVINHHFHPLHPLSLVVRRSKNWYCDMCDNEGLVSGFSYWCRSCDFDVCMKCGLAFALKEEALIKFKHEGHPEHTLVLQLRSASFRCDACHAKDEDLFYQCDSCDFWIHKTCASLAPTINLPLHPNHPLILVYSLPDNFYNFNYYCEFCKKRIHRTGWLYHCANCRYFAHIKCALNAEKLSIPSNVIGTYVAEECVTDVMHFPMSDAFTNPLKLLHLEKMTLDDDHVATEINHWSHNHPLILNVEPQGNNIPNICCSDPIKVCFGCVQPLSLPYYNCKDGCSFTLHKYCAELPLTLEHPLHPNHLLDLVDKRDYEYYYKCNGCLSYGNTFAYKCKTCIFYLDVNCAFLPKTIKHKTHKDPLNQVIDPKRLCKACKKLFRGIYYACKDCNFQLDMCCAVRSPHFVAHRYCKGHEISLTYPPVEDHPEDFYCDICEKEMHPKRPLYHCHKCKNSFHLNCVNRLDPYANTMYEGTRTKIVSYHKHPLTFVRRKKTSRYVCFGCNLDINGHLILECRTEKCSFRACYSCHRKDKR